MSYQPYPTGGSSYQPYSGGGDQIGQRPPQPRSVRIAVWLMYGGAALSVLSAILILVVSSSIRNAVHKALVKANATNRANHKAVLSAAQIHTAENLYIDVLLFVLVLSIALWIWMAWANGKGRHWARITATVLFAINTLYLVISVSRAGGSAIVVGLSWILGLGAIILIWRRESSQYYLAGRMK
jgi:hypothetical protein